MELLGNFFKNITDINGMNTKNKIHTLLLLTTFFTVSCVQDPSCANKTSATDASNASLAVDTNCSTEKPQEPLPDTGTENPPGEVDANSLLKPWKNEDTSIVIDAYEGNSIDWNKMATDTKVVGVIHRATIGTRIDTKYTSRRQIAKEKGYLWGAYHFGKRGDTILQANTFLSLIGNDPETLIVLDLEDTNASTLMNIDEAVVFMNYIYEKTGKIPVVYANHSTTKLLNQKVNKNILFKQSKLWYARFKESIPDFPIGIWSNYFLWQFSSEINCTSQSCLYKVPGTTSDMDVNVFNGPASELQLMWNND